MQPPAQPAVYRISYQIPRDVLVWIWWRRAMLLPRNLINMGSIVFLGFALFLNPTAPFHLFGFIPLFYALIYPFLRYRNLARAVDSTSVWTDSKHLEFGPSTLVVQGPDWKSEYAWSRYRGFSEDARYFYLQLTNNRVIVSVIPKSAYTPEQEEKFREYARANFG